jgi:hypothetical protein
MVRFRVALAAAVMLVAGCSSAGGPASHSSTPTVPAAPSYSPEVGADAALIAGHIPGCSGVESGSVGAGGPSMTSSATCTLQGHLVILDGFASPDDASISDSLTKDEYYFAYGGSWLAFLAGQGATAAQTVLQMQMTNDAAGLLRYATDNSTPPRASLDAQQQLSGVIAKALDGRVGHTHKPA